MSANPVAVDRARESRLIRVLRTPIVSIFVAFVCVAAGLAVANGILAVWDGRPWWVRTVLTVVIVHFSYVAYVRIHERRAVTELDRWTAGRGLILGFLCGVALFAAALAVPWAAGAYSIERFIGWQSFVPALAVALGVAYVEEVLFRGVLYRLLERAVGTWLSVCISAVVFGLLHLGNPGATLWTSAAIAVEAGVLLATVFVLTRRLWVPIGLHLGWNFAAGGIFGIAVSGNEGIGLLKASLTGPQWLTGGAFGLEASPMAVILCAATASILLVRARRRGLIMAPPWKRNRDTERSAALEEQTDA